MSSLKINNNQKDNITKFKSNTTTTKLKSLLGKIKSIFNNKKGKGNVCSKLIKKIIVFKSEISILTQIIIILIPCFILCIFLLIVLHIYFFDELYYFNLEKGLKENFMDDYLVASGDLETDIDVFIAKENGFDVEGQLFFEIYYKELISLGILDNPNQKAIPDINSNSEKLYLIFDNLSNNLEIGDIYTISNQSAKDFIDNRNDSLGELAKLYYYMIPIIEGKAFERNDINRTFLVAYEFDENKTIINKELFFKFPRNKYSFIENSTNFNPYEDILNPMVNDSNIDNNIKSTNDSYSSDNWFTKQDLDFRELVNFTQEGYSKTSFAHLNHEYNGYIYKSRIISSQQYINRNNSYYIINIIFFFKMDNTEINANNNSNFILKSNQDILNGKNEYQKYSDNSTYVISQSEAIEYSLNSIDYQYFHNGLFNKKSNFIINGISFDSFNLNYFSDPLKYYSTIKNYEVDLTYLNTLFLYKMLFQSLNFTIIKRQNEKLYLYCFNDANKIKNIRNTINFEQYIKNMKKIERKIEKWSQGNEIFYDEQKFKETSRLNSNYDYPNCTFLPLLCFDNYEQFESDFNVNFNNISYSSKINLPNKCQHEFRCLSAKNYFDNNSYNPILQSPFNEYIKSKIKINKINIIKFHFQKIYQLSGFSFFSMSIMDLKINYFGFIFEITTTKLDITIIFIFVLFIVLIIKIIIIYKHLNNYKLIISEFKEKYDLYVISTNENINNNIKTKKDKDVFKINDIEEELVSLLENERTFDKNISNINDNDLLEDLFSIFCKHYNISRKDIEKYYLKNKKDQTKSQLNLEMMIEKNELFELLAKLSIITYSLRFNINFDYNMYNHSIIIKKYNKYISQVLDIDKEQTRLTQNILYELLSTENISDYGLITNFYCKYISNIKAELKENSIQNAMFINIFNRMKGQEEDELSINDIFKLIKCDDNKQSIKLILKETNNLIDVFKDKFESDSYLSYYKLENSINFFLINTYYKYLKQILL